MPTEIICRDTETGETETQVIENDYCVVTDGSRYIDGLQQFGNGTVVITIKRGNRDADGE